MFECGHAPVHVDDIVVSIVGEGRGPGWVVVGPASPPVGDSLLPSALSAIPHSVPPSPVSSH